MTKEQAFQNWWSAWLGDSTFGMERYREAFEAGYEARRAEEDEALEVIRSAAEYYKATNPTINPTTVRQSP